MMRRSMKSGLHEGNLSPRAVLVAAWMVVFIIGLDTFLISGCSSKPSLVKQEQMIRNNDLELWKLEPRSFVSAWGEPTYQRMEFTPFFGMKDGSLIPRSRLPLGEPPPGWGAAFESGNALYLVYPDHGWLVVFLDESLVYREALSADKLHELGRSWAHEDKFKTKLETSPP